MSKQILFVFTLVVPFFAQAGRPVPGDPFHIRMQHKIKKLQEHIKNLPAEDRIFPRGELHKIQELVDTRYELYVAHNRSGAQGMEKRIKAAIAKCATDIKQFDYFNNI